MRREGDVRTRGAPDSRQREPPSEASGGSVLDQLKEQQGDQGVWREVSQGTVVGHGVGVNRALVT